MTPELAGRTFDALLGPEWREARLVSGNRRVLCPLHDDQDPSLDIHPEKLVWTCRAGCGGGGAWDLAVRLRGDEGARALLRQLDTMAPAARSRMPEEPRERVEVLGPPTSAQTAALRRARRVCDERMLDVVGARLVAATLYEPEDGGEVRRRREYVGIPTIAADGWKLWALNRNGVPRLDKKSKLIRRNIGSGSLVVSPALRERGPMPTISRLWDVEGESDLLAAIDAGLSYVVTGTGGAGSLTGHEAHAEWLRSLAPGEVCIMGDLDRAGREGAEKRAARWLSQGVPVRVVELPDALGEKGDLRDYLNGRPARNGSAPVEALGDATTLGQRADAAELRTPLPTAALDPEDVADDEEVEVPDDGLTFPASAVRGSFRAFLDYLAPVTGAAPAHGFAAWHVALAASIGATRWGTWSGRVVPVTFNLLCGPTGDHKSTAADLAMSLLPPRVLRIDGVTSDAGLFDALEEGRATVLHFDELGFLLKMAGLSGSTLDSMLNRLWGAPQHLDRNLSKRTAGGGARRVERPFACLLAGTHPDTFWIHLGDDRLAISSGFVNRLCVYVVEHGRSLPVTAAPDDVAGRALRAHLEQLAGLSPAPVRLEASAEALWRDFSRDHDERLGALDVVRASVAKRLRDHVARLALVFAVDTGREVVTEEDLAAAVEVGGYLEASYARLLVARQAERGPARAASLETIARTLLAKRPPSVWNEVRSLIRSWPNASRPSSDELRRVLRAMDGVEIDPPSGRRKERYRLAIRSRPTRHPTHNPPESKGANVVCRVGEEGPRAL